MKNCLIVLHENFSHLNKGYQKIALERINLLSLKYNIDLIIPYYNLKPKKFLNKKNINYYFYKKNFFINILSFLYKIITFKPFQVALYYNFNFKSFIKKNFLKKSYDLKYFFLYRGFENILFQKEDYVILDLIDPVEFSLKNKAKKSYFKILYIIEAMLCDRYEKKISKYVNKTIIISSRDKKLIKNFKNIFVFPHMIDKTKSTASIQKKSNLCFSGNLNYIENLNYIKWLNQNIISKMIPNPKLFLIGSNPKIDYINNLGLNNFEIIANPKNIIKTISKFKVSLNGKSLYGCNTKIFDAFSANVLPIITKEMKKDYFFKDYPLIAKCNKDYRNLITKLINNKFFYRQKMNEVKKFKKQFTINNIKNFFFNIIQNNEN